MKTIATMLEEGVIDLSLKASRKKQAIKELAALLAGTGKVSDCEKIAKAVLAREKVASTGIGHGIAIPHKLSPSVQETVMVFGRSKEGIAFDAIDRKPAHLLFFIVGPENSSADHLKLLSRLSRLLTQESFRDQLMEARSPEEVVALFRNNEES
ncbi:PTS sugar transporter subunit IIA [Sediminispirochaeta smaragdinae]|uniref:PTS IIA-like nitrogen-regulatory protein PtsN n=1 Tax=Sediminispirochaeta smaragdinae (strain DSM 11293 / JCM 15392 / SEBR 4228) TaxID=573413 RepID=E1R7Z6_SEDSS|nr:PTS sugar transporter subunit IIA [Sediminispirochaeta smaragdinae]ADK82851.1 putative PTS IIA-like nitrogen-regulatory protein PtsN [Sediminispirochaeta smaragdinae DSM 11293]